MTDDELIANASVGVRALAAEVQRGRRAIEMLRGLEWGYEGKCLACLSAFWEDPPHESDCPVYRILGADTLEERRERRARG